MKATVLLLFATVASATASAVNPTSLVIEKPKVCLRILANKGVGVDEGEGFCTPEEHRELFTIFLDAVDDDGEDRRMLRSNERQLAECGNAW